MPSSSGWPHAIAVVSLGSNGKIVWHMSVHADLEKDRGHWGVTSSNEFYFAWGTSASTIMNRYAGRRVDANTVCLGGSSSSCGGVLQRITP